MKALIELLSILAWPLTVLTIIVMFRRELRGLADRIVSHSYKELRAEFTKSLEAIELQEQALPGAPVRPLPAGGPYDEKFRRLTALAEISPRAAVIEAWIEVECSVAEASRRAQLEETNSAPKALTELVRRRVVPRQFLNIADELRRLRNIAAHANEFILTAGLVRQYIEGAMALILMIDMHSK